MAPRYSPRPTTQERTAAELFEELGAAMASRYALAEEQMIERIANLVRKGLIESPGPGERARVLRELRIEGERIARELSDPALAARILSIAATAGEAAAVARLGITASQTSQITPVAANAVAQLALNLSSDLDNMSARITRWMPDVYQRVISMVAPQVILGTDTLQEAQRTAAQQFLARGVRGFTDKAGREWRIGTYAEMATRTSVNRAWMDANIESMSTLADINLVTIVIGVNACQACAAHAGKIYSTDGTPAGTYQLEHASEPGTVSVTVAGTLDSARATGWNHPNCRCVVVGYFPGLSKVTGSTYDPEAEKNRDKLRELERRVRDIKRQEAAAFDDVSKAAFGRRKRAAQARIRQFTAETGLLRRNYREQLSFSDGTIPAIEAPRPRALTP